MIPGCSSSKPPACAVVSRGKRHVPCSGRSCTSAGTSWPRARWHIRTALGTARPDTIILQAQFGQRSPTMPELAANTVATARALYNNATANTVKAAFVARGILK